MTLNKGTRDQKSGTRDQKSTGKRVILALQQQSHLPKKQEDAGLLLSLKATALTQGQRHHAMHHKHDDRKTPWSSFIMSQHPYKYHGPMGCQSWKGSCTSSSIISSVMSIGRERGNLLNLELCYRNNSDSLSISRNGHSSARNMCRCK